MTKKHHAKRRNATWHSKQVQFILRSKIEKISVPDFPNAKENGTKTQILHPILLPSVCCFYDFDCNMIPNLWVGVQVQVHRTGTHQHWYKLYRHCEFQVDFRSVFSFQFCDVAWWVVIIHKTILSNFDMNKIWKLKKILLFEHVESGDFFNA